IDIAEAKKRSVTIANTPGVSSLAVAEHAVALMLALATRIVEGDDMMRRGAYKGWAPMNLIGTDLSGKTIGLIGVGHIGSDVAQIMKLGFGANILYYDVNPNAIIEERFGAKRLATVEELLGAADFISLHVPLLDSTHHLIDGHRLALMKPTAFLINTSRGPVIDEKALVRALRDRRIAGAGLDVFEFEPKLSSGLAKLQNVVLTPHIASARQSVRDAMAVLAAKNIIDSLEGRAPANKVA
ncbi:MAG: D-glycerate dehydrogenase, partial [Patescibacteria group bacterium]|nr:D-glycerate dehydrogenase [Patescibacteria group bacterium]